MAGETSTAVQSNPVTSEAGTSQQEHNNKSVDVKLSGDGAESAKERTESEEVTEAAETNGDAEHPATDTAEPPASTENTDMKDADDSGNVDVATTAPVEPQANGTPAHSKRVSTGGSSKKKSSAVPEHKSKKLNKKKSRPLTNLNAQAGEYYIARMKGHPPWPSVVCDEDMLPQSLISTRPVTAQLPDGSFKKPEYADGGKRAYERTFPIMFLHTNEFAWIPNTELALLDVQSEAVTNPVEKGKSKTLLAAYSKAAENNDLAHFKTMLAEHQKALDADVEEREERQAKKEKKKSRKSADAVALADDADDMEIDDELPVEKPKSKKRKKADDNDDENEKPAKTPKTATKLKLSTPKTPASEPSTKKKAPKSKAKAVKSGSDDEAETTRAEEKSLTPQQIREMKEKKVLYYRHKLQRGFLSRDTTPKEDEMKSMSEFLAELEGYPDLEGSIIRTTKIHKVLKAMIKLATIPLDEEFNFKSRSMALLGKWNEILSNEPGHANEKDDEGKADAPTTNGDVKDSGEQELQAAAGEGVAPEDEGDAKLENKIGTTVEGEKEADEPEGDTKVPEKTAEEQKTDGPAIDSAPEAEFKPEEAAEAA